MMIFFLIECRILSGGNRRCFLPIADPFEPEEFHGGAGTDFELSVVLDLHEIFVYFTAGFPFGLQIFRRPDIILDGTDGIVVNEGALGQFAGDVGIGEVLLFVTESVPVAASAFFFAGARSVGKEL